MDLTMIFLVDFNDLTIFNQKIYFVDLGVALLYWRRFVFDETRDIMGGFAWHVDELICEADGSPT